MRPLSASGLAPGETGPVEIRLEAPVSAVRGDRYIVRRPSPAATLGGGEILDPLWRRHRGTVLGQALAALQGDLRATLGFWAQEAGERGVDAAGLARRLGVPSGPGRSRAARARRRAKADRHACGRTLDRARRGATGNRARPPRPQGVLPEGPAGRSDAQGGGGAPHPPWPGSGSGAGLLRLVGGPEVLTLQGDQVTLPGRSAQLTGEESKLSLAVVERFDKGGLTPPSPGDLSRELNAKPQILEGVMRHLVARGHLIRLPDGLILAASAVAGLKRDLLATSWERFSVPEFKDRFGLSRKWAIPLLEHLDSTGATRRVGDERLVVRPAAGDRERRLA